MLGRLHAINSLDDTTEIMGSELLDLCKRNPNDLAKIKSVVENCPESATKYRDNDGRTALHVLCANRPSLQSVAFLAADPNSCRRRTSKGMLPLHYICREQASEDVVDFMLSQYPESVQVPTASGWFPLHLACARGSSLGVIQRLIQEWPESARQATQDGRMALHFACANHAPLQVVQLLVQQNWHAIQVQDRNQWTPLHIACAYSRNLDIIRYLVDEWKDGMLCHGKLKQLPLHVACWEGQELPIVNFLVEACPQAVLMRDSNSRLPLHCACQGNAGMPVIQYLIVQAPASALELGETVEEIAVYSMNKGVSQNAPSPQPAWCEWLKQNVPAFENESVDVTTFPVISKTTEKEEPISLNLQKRGNAKQSTNKQEISESLAVLTPSNVAAVGTLKQPQTQAQLIAHKQINLTSDQNQRPRRGQKQRTKSPQNESNKKHAPEVVSVGKTLHEACERPQSLNEIVRLLSEKPAAIEVTTYNNMLPIHTASLNEASAEILEVLISFSPHSVCQQDVEGNLPIHLACYSGATFESIEVLVKQWPASLEMKNTQGQTPLDKARSPFLHDPDYQIISYLESQISRNLQGKVLQNLASFPRLSSLNNRMIFVAFVSPTRFAVVGTRPA